MGVRAGRCRMGVGSGYRRFHSSFDLATAAIVVVLVVGAVVAMRTQRRHTIEPAE